MEKAIAQSNTQKEQALKELYNQTAFEQDSEFIRQFFEEAKQQLATEGLSADEKFGKFLTTAKNALVAAVNELPNVSVDTIESTTLDQIYSAVETSQATIDG